MKKYSIRVFFLFVFLSLAILILINKKDINLISRYIYKNDWAILNYGQIINDTKGMKGVDINIIPAWKISTGNPNIIVAVIDTGVDISCDIFNNNIKQGWDFYNNDLSIYDDYLYDYHGTYISTTIVKVAPNISILPVKFMEATMGSIDDLTKSIQYAIEQGARIVNCSWNLYEDNKDLYELIRNNPDVLFVCAAGNSNVNLDEAEIYPCSYDLDNIINVMAINNEGKMYQFSGYGKESVDIAAPGVDVKIILPQNDEYYISGTSVSAAFVSASAALIMSTNNSLSPSEVKDLIILSSTKTESLETLCKAGGYINIYNCLYNCTIH